MLEPHREHRILIVLTLMSFTNILDFMIMMPLASRLIREFGITTAQFGLLVSAYAFSASAASLLMASIADRFDRRHTLFFVYAGLIVGTLGCALAPNYVTLLVARTVAGMFGGVMMAVVFSIIGDLVPDERRGRAMATVMLSFALSSVFGVPLAIYIVTVYGNWHAPFAALSIVCAVLFVIAWRQIPSMREHMREDNKSIGFIQGYAELLRVSNHWWAFAMMALLMLSGMLVIPYIAPSLVANGNMNESDLSWVYLLGGAITLVTRPYFGYLSDRYRRATVYYWLVLLSVIPILLVTHASHGHLSWQLAITMLFFAFVGGRFIPATALITSATVPQLRGRLMSFNSAVQNFFTGLASVIGGAMMTTGSHGEMLGYGTVGYLAAFVGIVSIWMAYKVRMMS